MTAAKTGLPKEVVVAVDHEYMTFCYFLLATIKCGKRELFDEQHKNTTCSKLPARLTFI